MRNSNKLLSLFFFVTLTFGILSVHAQNNTVNTLGQTNVVTTSVPFLLISPDARAGAMGDAGVSSSPDINSQHWNPAKYAFMEKNMGFSAAYSPWLRSLVSDINLAYLTGYKKIGDMQAISASLLYFSLGDIAFTDDHGTFLNNYRPNEFAIDAAYSRKFSDHISGAVSARYINSNLTQGQVVSSQSTKAGQSFATDVALYYEKDMTFKNNLNGKFAFGINISNIGSKISYSNDATKKDFIPTNLRLGPSLLLNLDEFNSLTFMLDLNKLLVPTPPIYKTDSLGLPVYDANQNQIILKGKNPNVSVVSGMLQSFYDAPDGFSEELHEITYSLGVEYWYDKQFAIRGGYFYEDKTKGNRKFFTLGAGLKYNVFGLDFSYLIPTEQKNPLENTLRFTLLFDFDAFKAQRR